MPNYQVGNFPAGLNIYKTRLATLRLSGALCRSGPILSCYQTASSDSTSRSAHMKSAIIFLPALTAAAASPFQRRSVANAGATSSDVFPATGSESFSQRCLAILCHGLTFSSAQANSALFPGETVIGFPGVTATGAEPLAIQTAAAYPNSNEAFFPLVGAQPADNNASSDFSIFKTWGNLSPWYTVNSSFYSLNGASPLVPDQCEITQV